MPARRGISPLLGLLLALVGLALAGLLIAFFLGVFDSGGGVAGTDGQDAAATSLAATQLAGLSVTPGAESTVDPNATADPNAQPTAGAGAVVDPNATPDPNAQPTVDPNAPAPTADAGAGTGGTTAPPADLSGANPVVVPANTPLSSEGWLYDFNQPTYAAPIIGNLGQFAPNNGRFVVVLAFVVNNTGSPQSLPNNFFVLKDAQGRVWEGRPEVSEAYVIPGVNADLAQSGQIPPDGLTRSVAVIFDVAPDATNLVFFARSNPGQGWLVLQAV